MFIQDADDQLLNLDHVVRIRAKLMRAGGGDAPQIWDVVADVDLAPGSILCTLARGFESRQSATDWMLKRVPGIVTLA